MASNPHRRAATGAIAVSGGLAVAGGVTVWAFERGLWGTATLVALVAVWLAVVLCRPAIGSRQASAVAVAMVEREQEWAMLRLLLDQAPAPLLAVEGEMHVRALNRAARRLFATDDRLAPPPQCLLSPTAARLRHGGRSWRIDRVIVDVPGPPRTLLALVDVEAEEHAAEARATRELLRVLGHEVMNAMAPITSLAESALTVLPQPERRDRLLPEILGTLARRADGLRRFAEAYRQVARLPEPRLVPVQIKDLLADLARLFDGEWQQRATLEILDPPDAVASVDRDQITQALLALVRNGAEAAASVQASPVVRLRADTARGRLRFLVSDEGPGIDPSNRMAVFMPFFTTKPDGDGIGLAAARQIAQSHGGYLSLRQVRPTTFELSIPR